MQQLAQTLAVGESLPARPVAHIHRPEAEHGARAHQNVPHVPHRREAKPFPHVPARQAEHEDARDDHVADVREGPIEAVQLLLRDRPGDLRVGMRLMKRGSCRGQ